MSDAVMVVRYRESERTATEQALRRLIRTRAILQLVLALLITLIGPGIFVLAAVSTGEFSVGIMIAIVALLMIPVAMCVFAARQLRRRVRLPEVAVTITPHAVLFPAIERLSVLSPRIRAEEWAREGTSAEILPAAGLNAERVAFTRWDNGKRRRRAIAAGTIDVDPRVIVDVLRGRTPGPR